MSSREIYVRSPIVEALVSFSVTPAPDWEEDNLRGLREKLSDHYPEVEDLHEGKLKLEVHSDQVVPDTPQPMQLPWQGLRFWTKERTRAVILRKDVFTYSILRPYERWETLRDEAREVWDIYRGAMTGARITRSAVRYINRFDLPEDTVELLEYFTLRPELPVLEEFRRVSGYFLQLQFPQEDLGAQLLVNQGTTQSETFSILLDLDLATQPSAESQNEDERWALIERFHQRLHKVFESLITEKARDLIR